MSLVIIFQLNAAENICFPVGEVDYVSKGKTRLGWVETWGIKTQTDIIDSSGNSYKTLTYDLPVKNKMV